MILSDFKYIYFLGIGGIGMSAIARYFLKRGVQVGGYDRTLSEITNQLSAEGAEIIYSDEPLHLSKRFKQSTRTDILVIYTPAVPKDLSLLKFFRDNRVNILKRSEILGLISSDSFTLGVAGTHGKTTTSTMLSHVLIHGGYSVTAFLGGISGNYGSNFLDFAQGKDFPESDGKGLLVVEADEYDRSFLQLNPSATILTSADADHLDIYGNSDSVLESYRSYLERVSLHGPIILKKHVKALFHVENSARVFTYSLDDDADYVMSNLRYEGQHQLFSCSYHDKEIGEFQLSMPGRHNVENALAVIALCHSLNIETKTLASALSVFKGVKRRFEICYVGQGKAVIDDYAHHPEEIRAAVSSARLMFPGKKITGVFQPHLYSRTRDFCVEFAQSLDLVDRLLLMDIYPARELPIEGVSRILISGKLKSAECKFVCHDDFLDFSKEWEQTEVLLIMGAGDVDKVASMVVPYITGGAHEL